MQEKIHLKGFNGIRAIGIISVVISHTAIWGGDLAYIIPSGLAQYAVTLFFTLSGFLITYLLFMEKKKAGVSIRNFYIRRMLRIWPMYFAYLFTVLIIIYIHQPGKLPGSLPWYLFFAANIPYLLKTELPYLVHYWTLGVEEQFYIFWPWVIKRSKRVLRTLVIFTACFFILKLACRFIYFEWGNITPLFVVSNTRFECMSLGGIAALLCLENNRSFLKILTYRVTEIFCWLCLLVMIINRFYITPLLDHDLAALIGIGLIVNLGFNKKPLISLETRFFDLVGKLSYGMYIIHPLVITYYYYLLDHLHISNPAKTTLLYAGSLLITFGIAWFMYEFFEKRFLRMKDRFSVVKSRDSGYGR